MIYGLYLSGQGAEAASLRQAVLANNMANAGTTAFKPDVPVFQAHLPFDVARQQPTEPPDTINEQTGGVSLVGTVTDFSQGPLEATHGKFDLAVVGPGFFQVTDGKETFLTRNGRFTLDAAQRLVTADQGHAVLGVDGQPIVIPPEAVDVTIAADGAVVTRDFAGATAAQGQVALFEPENELELMKAGDSYYEALGKLRPAGNAQVRQGMLEGSGVQPVSGMVELIQSARSFEMNMSLVRFQDEMLAQLLQSMPRR